MSERQYLDLMETILEKGHERIDRTGVGTLSIFGADIRTDLREGFPAFTTRTAAFKTVMAELLWFIKGDTNIRFLVQNKCKIWNEWAFQNWVYSEEYDGEVDMTDFGLRAEKDEAFNKIYKREMKRFLNLILTDDAFAERWGELGRIYGKQWRCWIGEDGQEIDQLQDLIHLIKTDPNSRRMIVMAWQPSIVVTPSNPNPSNKASLPPCHIKFQTYVADGVLSLKFDMRSTDVFLGLFSNLMSYGALTELLARECGLKAGELIYSGSDVHIYKNHIEQVKEQLTREPFPLPKLKINSDKSMFDLELSDFELVGYVHHPSIKAPVAV